MTTKALSLNALRPESAFLLCPVKRSGLGVILEQKMNEEEFETYLADAIEELRIKQDALKTEYGLGEFSRWWFEQKTALLQFFDE